MYVSYLVNLHSFVNISAYHEPRNTFEDILKFYADRAVGKNIKLCLWVASKPRNSQNSSVKFFLKHPVLQIYATDTTNLRPRYYKKYNFKYFFSNF